MKEKSIATILLLECTGIPQEMATKWDVPMVPKGHISRIYLELTDGTNETGTPSYQTAEQVAQNYPGIRVQVSGSSAICKECNLTAHRAAGNDEQFLQQIAALYE